MSGKRILVVDDEPKVRELIRTYLQREGNEIVMAGDGNGAVEMARSLAPDLVVLDLNLPEIDGLEAFRRIRSFSNVPVIMVTARDEETDRITGLQLGADDYVAKPFSPRELAARANAVLRRCTERAGRASILSVGELVIDQERHEVRFCNELVQLTAVEFRLLSLMANRPGWVFSRLQLMDLPAGEPCEGYARIIDVHIKNIRQKMERIGNGAHNPIVTVWGFGYKIEEVSPGAQAA